MKVEYSDNGRKPPKKNKKRKTRLKPWFLASVALVIVIAVTVTLMLTVFFNVAAVKVIGSSIYSENAIISASGINNGDNIIRMSKDDIAENITKKLPYVKSVTVSKALPDTVGIKVTPATESYTILTDDGFFVADKDYKVLRSVSEKSEKLVSIVGLNVKAPAAGSLLTFNDKQQRDVLNRLVDMCDAHNFELKYIDIKSLVDIKFVINGKLYIKLGSYTEMAGKLTHLNEMLKSVDDNVSASISLVDWSHDNKKAVLKYEDTTQFWK